MKKVERARELSDLDSQSESTSTKITNGGAKKRKIVKTKLTRFASYELTEDSSDSAINLDTTLPEPPKLNGMFVVYSLKNALFLRLLLL